MAKRKCSAYDLMLLVEHRLDKPAIVKIERDKALGWRPIVLTGTGDSVSLQMQADAAADELRKRYDLA